MASEKKKIHVKKGDTVVVITGKDAGQKGKIIDVDTKNGRVYVEQLNMVSRHTKPTQAAPQGGIVKKEAPIDASNVMILDKKTNKPTRIYHDVDKKTNKKVRVGKSHEKLD